jgi:hypothetical protein
MNLCILLLIDMDLLCVKLASTKSDPFPVADVDTFGRDNNFSLRVVSLCYVDRCLSFRPFFFRPLCCLFFFDIRILITPLVSSNPS